MTAKEMRLLPRIGQYKELGFANEDSIRLHINKPMSSRTKEQVLEYMRKSFVYSVKVQYLYDIFTNQPIMMESTSITNGYYQWESEIIYYVEKYDLELPKEFIEMALTNRQIQFN